MGSITSAIADAEKALSEAKREFPFKVGDRVRVREGQGVAGVFQDGELLEVVEVQWEERVSPFDEIVMYLAVQPVGLSHPTGGWLPNRFELVRHKEADEQDKDRLNPKDAMGRSKLPLFSVIPTTGLIEEAKAMRYGAYEAPRKDGGKGYGPFNWRDTEVAASVYLDACCRHILSYLDGEDCAADSGAHHLGHARACLGIILDAMANGTLMDDRPTAGRAAELLEAAKRKP